jgi:hypothetical protein
MTSIDGLFAILEDRGLMPAVALFSLSAVLGLLYLSSGNLKAPNPHLRQDVDARHSMRSDMARLPIRGMTLNRAWLPRHPRSAITDASHVDSSKKDTVGKESKKHES